MKFKQAIRRLTDPVKNAWYDYPPDERPKYELVWVRK